MKRKRINRISPTPRRKLERTADKLWAEVIKLRDKGICQMCGKPGNQPHHIVTRSVKHLRHAIHNGVLLCAGCHTLGLQSAHKRPEAFRQWLIDKWFKSEEKYNALILESNTVKMPDYNMAILWLEELLGE